MAKRIEFNETGYVMVPSEEWQDQNEVLAVHDTIFEAFLNEAFDRSNGMVAASLALTAAGYIVEDTDGILALAQVGLA